MFMTWTSEAGFWTLYGAEDLSRINPSPAGVAGGELDSTQLLKAQKPLIWWRASLKRRDVTGSGQIISDSRSAAETSLSPRH